LAHGAGHAAQEFRRFEFLKVYEDFRKKAGQAGIKSVGRTGLKGNDCIRMANGPASSWI
jgi:hypothetical protein